MAAPVAVTTMNFTVANAKTSTKFKKSDVTEEWVYTPKQYQSLLRHTPQEFTYTKDTKAVQSWTGDEATTQLEQVLTQAKQYYAAIGATNAVSFVDEIWQQREAQSDSLYIYRDNGKFSIHGYIQTGYEEVDANGKIGHRLNGPIIFE